MKDTILIILAARWDQDAEVPEAEDGSEDARIGNAIAQGHRECKRECADTLRQLIDLLGQKETA